MNLDENINPFIIENLEWDSDFFNKKIGQIVYKRDDISSLKQEEIKQFLYRLIEEKRESFQLIQIAFDSNDYFLFTPSQQSGFEVVEIRLVFKTQMNKDVKSLLQKNPYQLEVATDKDMDSIIKLLNRSFIYNPDFFSRFNNESYFTIDDAKRYYEFNIKSALADKNKKLVLCKDKNNTLIGFMSLLSLDKNSTSLPVLRVGLTAISKEYKGKKIYSSLNSYLLSTIEYNNYILQNITHIYNTAMLKNYNKLQKIFCKTEYILYFNRDTKNV